MEIQVLLLAKTAYGENSLRLSYIDAETGFGTAFKRAAKRLSGKAQPDLFDTALMQTEPARKGQGQNVKSYTPLHRRNHIPRNYDRFEYACRVSILLCKNGPYLEDARQTHRLANLAFDAFDNPESPPHIIYLKFLYQLLRQEGFPVLQSWRQTLPGNQGDALAHLLARPLEHLTDHPTHPCDELIQSLENWTRHESSIQIPS